MPGVPIRRVALIQPSQPFPNMMSRVVMPRYGLPLIATILRRNGYDATAFVEEVHPINWEIVARADAVCFSTLTCSVGNMARHVEKIRALRPGAPIIVGDTHATYWPRSVLRHCDYVVRQEGDETILDLLDALKTGRDPATVAGITFFRDGELVRTPDRPPVANFDTVVDLSTIYGWEEAYKTGRRYRLMTIQTSRGCPYRCKFCPVAAMFGSGYRKRSIDSVIADLKDKVQYSKYVMFIDNNFAADPGRTAELLRRIIDEGIRAHITVFCRGEIRKRPDLLRLMKRAGVTTIFLGVESLNPATLQAVNKCQTIEETEEAIRTIERHGIRVLTSLLMGVDTDTRESLAQTRRLLLKWRIAQLTVFCYWGGYVEDGEYGTPPNRWIFKEYGYMNGNFVFHFPLNMKPSTLQREMMATYDQVLAPARSVGDFFRGRWGNALWRLIFWKAWRATRPHVEDYIDYLEEIEQGYYDENERLIVEKMDTRPELPWVMHNMS